MDIKIIGFDADDTLWINEPLFQETEKKFCEILAPYLQETALRKELFKTEMQNLEMYGYGVKGFMLSMIETATRVSFENITAREINQIIRIGKDLLNQPIVLLDNVEDVLKQLQPHYKLILATKGDLLDQEQKLNKSGLAKYFHHIEIMSDKREKNFRKLINHLDIEPENFIMIGNSVKSDILPVINIGANAIHVPCETTWLHEIVHVNSNEGKFITVNKIADILNIINHV